MCIFNDNATNGASERHTASREDGLSKDGTSSIPYKIITQGKPIVKEARGHENGRRQIMQIETTEILSEGPGPENR
jgi:hypothetical protein